MYEDSIHSASIIHQPGNRCFAERRGGLLDYDLDRENRFVITHIIVPEHLRGRGIAAQLMEIAITYAEKNGLTIIAQCDYAASYLKKRSAE